MRVGRRSVFPPAERRVVAYVNGAEKWGGELDPGRLPAVFSTCSSTGVRCNDLRARIIEPFVQPVSARPHVTAVGRHSYK